MRGDDPLSDKVAASLRPKEYAGAGGGDSAPRGKDVDAVMPPAPSPGASPKFEDWLPGVAPWYVSREGSRVAADSLHAPANP